ncbi:MAG: chemotaxis protein CheW [Desulfovibrionaceae bacterium]
MADTAKYLVFVLDDHRFALPLAVVRRVERMVEVSPLSGAPPVVLGAINVKGRLAPVLDTRRRFGLPPREVRIADQLIFARAGERDVALWVDDTLDVMEADALGVVPADAVWPGFDATAGLARLGPDIVAIHDLERFFTAAETRMVDAALREPAPREA